MNATNVHDPSGAIDALRAVTGAAAGIYAEPARRAAARMYLEQRGIDVAELPSSWMVGFAPPGWSRLVDALRPDFEDQLLVDAGLARRTDRGGLIDTFRHRIVFGICAPDGAIAGFTGRDLSGNHNAPKYLNTCRHPAFDKSALLYGLYEGTSAPGARQPVVVEGPMDVLAIAAHQRSWGGADLMPVAPCGTAFTATHARQLAAIAESSHSPIVVAMDADTAGRAAALRTAKQLCRAGIPPDDVKVAELPDGRDPADHLARGGNVNAFRSAAAGPLLSALMRAAIDQQGQRMQWVEGRLSALHAVARDVAGCPPDYLARHVGQLARGLGLAPDTVRVVLDLQARIEVSGASAAIYI